MPTGGEPPRPTASELLARFIARVDAGEALEFEAFCREHPGESEELRTLRSDWLQMRQVFDRLGFTSSLPLDENESPSPAPIQGNADSAPGGNKGRYSVRGQLGRGGQGEVLSVWDENLRRPLAMKVVDPRSPIADSDHDSRRLARLLEEAQITAQLDHPGIVPVHELGLDPESRVFFTMKLVKGESLLAILERLSEPGEEWSTTRALGVLLRVCEAVAYAHSKGVIHRDLKPANVMVGRFGEVYVMDWGLARVLGQPDKKDIRLRVERAGAPAAAGGDTLELLRRRRAREPGSPLVTMDGDVVGTPAYMPPEQARGDLEALGPAADVYAVGAMLYHLLAGHEPYSTPGKRPDNLAVLARVLDGPPESLAARAPEAPRQLVAIADKAMARAPDARYASVLALAEDLRAYLEGRVVSAYERGLAAELRHWVKRNRALATTFVVAAALVLAGLGAAGYAQWRRLADARWASYVANLPLAHVRVEAGRIAEARRLLEACAPEHRGWEWHHVQLASDNATRVFLGHTGRVLDVAVDGRHAASASSDGSVRYWNLADGSSIELVSSPGSRMTSVALAPEAELLFAGSSDGSIGVWNTGTRARVTRLQGPGDPVTRLVLDPLGQLAAGFEDGTVYSWESPLERGGARVLDDPGSHYEALHALRFLEGDVLFSASRFSLKLWDLRTGGARALTLPNEAADAARDGRLALALRSEPGSSWAIEVRDGLLGKPVWSDPRTGAITALRFEPRGTCVASASLDHCIRLWADRDGALACTLFGHTSAITALAFGPDGRTLLAGAEDGSLRLWEAGVRSEHSFAASVWSVLGLAFGERDATLGILTSDGRLARLDARTGALLSQLRSLELVTETVIETDWPHPRVTHHGCAGVSADGTLVVVGRLDGHLRFYDARAPTLLAERAGHTDRVTALALSCDGSRVASGSVDGSLLLWDTRAQHVLQSVPAGRIPTALAFSRDGRELAWGSSEGDVSILDLRRRRAAGWRVAETPVTALALSPDGSRLACAAGLQQVTLWDRDRERELLTLRIADPGRAGVTGDELRAGLVTALAFSPDGERLVAATEGGRVVLWETRAASAAAWAGDWIDPAQNLVAPSQDLVPVDLVLEKTARSLADELLREHFFAEAVLAALLQSGDIGDALRERTAQLARERGDLEAGELVQIALDIVLRPGRSASAYERALRAAQAACSLRPDPLALLALGAAQFRRGEAETALVTLETAQAGVEDASEEALGLVHALHGLVLETLGRRDEALRELEAARALADRASSERLAECVRELAQHLGPAGGRGSGRSPPPVSTPPR